MLLGRKVMTNLDSVLKSRDIHYSVDIGPHSQGYGLPSDHPTAFAMLLMNEHHQSSMPPPGTLGLLAWTRAEALSKRTEKLKAPPSELLNILLQS